MAETIICPACGEINPARQEFCVKCRAPLFPLGDSNDAAESPILPGQFPTKKTTAELEPILPQWLRDARNEARKSAEEPQPPPPAPVSQPDLLAGLQSQTGDDEEETPDWLASITGKKSKSKKTEADTSDVRWVELGKPDEFMPGNDLGITSTQEMSGKGDNELPSWLVGSAPSLDGDDGLSSWIQEASARSETPTLKPSPLTESSLGSSSNASPLSDDETPDWLKSMQAEQVRQSEVRKKTEPLGQAPQTKSEALLSDSGLDMDWFNNLAGQPSPEAKKGAETAGTEAFEMPAWLNEEATPPTPVAAPATPAAADIPTWLRSAAETGEAAREEPREEAKPAEESIPEWLKTATPQPSVFTEETPTPAITDNPDWISALQKDQGAPAFEAETDDDGFSSPAFLEGTLAAEGADALFTEMPDWLSSVETGNRGAPSSEESTAAEKEESVSPGALPSWVQAMRPVESSIQPTSGATASYQTVETGGALAGLQGVLPAATSVGATSKPKSYSIKLQASEEQQSQSALLEQILAAETAPEPIAGFSPLAAQRGLRWALSIILLIVISGMLFLPSMPMFEMPGNGLFPVSEKDEVEKAMAIINALPEGAPALVVLDYEPALTGEMEASSAILLDTMIILKHPKTVYVSSNPMGAALANHLLYAPEIPAGYEGLITPGILKDRGLAEETDYVNLGYLPGGLAGVRAFAENPVNTMPYDVRFKSVWETGRLLAEKNSLSQFAVIIVITDSAESARTWIEQTASARSAVPVVVIASAQAAPMIRPYFASGQIRGLIGGLHGGAIVAQSSSLGNVSLARKYWDAFSVGMILAVIVIAGGGLWNLVRNLRDRVQEGK